MQSSNKTYRKQSTFRSLLATRVNILDICGVLLIILLVLTRMPLRIWTVNVFGDFLHWILLVAIGIFVFMLVKRRWWRVVLWGVPTLAFFILFGGLFLPRFDSQRIRAAVENPSSVHLRVMDWNLAGYVIANIQPQIDVIRDSGADIVALQEVSTNTEPAIEAQLAGLYPCRVLFRGNIAGTGILSKYPIESQEIFQLTPQLLYHCKAVIDVNGTPVTVISAHPPPAMNDYQFKYGIIEIRKLVEMASQGGPALLMGDFNVSDQTPDYRVIAGAGLKDTFREVGWGFGVTWPEYFGERHRLVPVVRIDYIWHTDDFVAESVRVGHRTLSDHRPVTADLLLEP